MTWSDLPFAPPTRTLRQFAALWLAFFTALALLQARRHGLTFAAGACLTTAVTVGPLGLWRPGLVRPLFVASMVLTFPLGSVVSRLTLAALYYGVLTPLGVALRLTGRDVLGLRHDPERTTYWEPRVGAHDARRYLRQF